MPAIVRHLNNDLTTLQISVDVHIHAVLAMPRSVNQQILEHTGEQFSVSEYGKIVLHM